MIAMKPIDELTIDPNRYYMTTAQRRAVWHNEISMFMVLAMPLIVATFWYGVTYKVVVNGQVTTPASFGRGVGLTLLVSLILVIGSAVWLFIQRATDRIGNAQPVSRNRRLSFAAFDGLLVFLITYQTLPDTAVQDAVLWWAISLVLGVAAGLIAYVAMHSMVDIPPGASPNALQLWRAQIENR